MLRTRSGDFAMRWGLCLLAICVMLAVTDGRHSDHKHKIRIQRSSSQPDARIENIKDVLFGPEGTKVKQVSSGSSDPNSSGNSASGPISASPGSSDGSFEPPENSSGSSETTEDPSATTENSSSLDSSASNDQEDNLPKKPLAPKLLLKPKLPPRKPVEDKHKPLELTR